MTLRIHPTLTFYGATLWLKGDLAAATLHRGRRAHSSYYGDAYFVRLHGRRIGREGDQTPWRNGPRLTYDLYVWYIEAQLEYGSFEEHKLGATSVQNGIYLAEKFVYESLNASLKDAYAHLCQDIDEGGVPWHAMDCRYLMDFIGHDPDYVKELRAEYVVNKALAIAVAHEAAL